MRITKKYTGDSCLGKRVFRSDINIDDHDEVVVNDRMELERLEHDFRLKLQQQQSNSRGRANSFNFTTVSRQQQEDSHVISTPAIDALVLQGCHLAKNSSSSSSSSTSDGPQRVSSHGVLKDMPPHMQHMTHAQLLGQLTEEAAQVLANRRRSSSSSSSHRQVPRDFQSHSQKSEEDDIAHLSGARRSQYQSREEQYQQKTQWQRSQLRGGQSSHGPSNTFLGQKEELETSASRGVANDALSSTLTHKRARADSTLGEDDEGADTAVLSLLGFLSTPQTARTSSTPPRTQRQLGGAAGGGGSLNLWEESARLLSELASSGSSCCSGSEEGGEGGEESDMSELSTQAIAGFV
eukprot:gene25046-31456_t